MNEKFREQIENATKHYALLLEEQLERAEKIKEIKDFVDYSKKDKIIIGVCGGDGIGPSITSVTH
ncbi:MAG: isocitrate/isopropylmalate dehydrogenase family protein, partial [Clostridia bacterium]|nr:isocitrate/isopropylmalate dehydrogenase family protein [Clostridia bacterium]